VIAATIAQPFADPKWLYLDPLAAAERAPECCRVYFGAMSMLGVMMWVVAAGICLFTALLFYLTGLSARLQRFALAAGLFTGWLALDDAPSSRKCSSSLRRPAKRGSGRLRRDGSRL
jgi:hypothetical protein